MQASAGARSAPASLLHRYEKAEDQLAPLLATSISKLRRLRDLAVYMGCCADRRQGHVTCATHNGRPTGLDTAEAKRRLAPIMSRSYARPGGEASSCAPARRPEQACAGRQWRRALVKGAAAPRRASRVDRYSDSSFASVLRRVSSRPLAGRSSGAAWTGRRARCQGRSKTHPFAPVENSPPVLIYLGTPGLGPGGPESAVSGSCGGVRVELGPREAFCGLRRGR
jgi:hypothetical protein